jgi:hypothetical protein
MVLYDSKNKLRATTPECGKQGADFAEIRIPWNSDIRLPVQRASTT